MSGRMAQPMPELGYTQEQLDAMSKEDLLLLYRSSGCQELKWTLALRYVGLVKSIALQVRGVYSSFAQVDDIINEGVLALVGAVDKFDPDKGIKFETFVSKRIRGAVIDLARRRTGFPAAFGARPGRSIRPVWSFTPSWGAVPQTRRSPDGWESPASSTRRTWPTRRCATF